VLAIKLHLHFNLFSKQKKKPYMRFEGVTEKPVVVSGNTVVVVGRRNSFRKLTGCMASPSWKMYSILPSI
jgi:UDP-N-acetylglucosamine 2-epimerase